MIVKNIRPYLVTCIDRLTGIRLINIMPNQEIEVPTNFLPRYKDTFMEVKKIIPDKINVQPKIQDNKIDDRIDDRIITKKESKPKKNLILKGDKKIEQPLKGKKIKNFRRTEIALNK